MDELFIYLAKYENIHVFQHLIKNEDTSVENIHLFSAQIYNLMISETMIQTDDIVLVFHLNKNYREDHTHLISVVSHHEFEQIIIDKDNVKQLIVALIQAKSLSNVDEEWFIISMKIEDNQIIGPLRCYEICEPGLYEVLHEISIDESDFDVSIEYVETCKEIDYL